ncbi:hypothetical protein N431DRAFT_476947 [Stipitochalara longipes BDJ]|nr:hypothetical protein N431DRAFT_476947 [Stipitochalara longipes BDJ]
MASQQVHEGPSLSCLTCRQRKIKCDKLLPCSGCRKSKFSCSYPSKLRSRTKKAGSNQELKLRLEKLEGLVETLSKPSTDRDPALPAGRINGEETVNSAELGRLVTEGDESRYIENSFWVTLSNEVSGIKQLLMDGSDDEHDTGQIDPNPNSSTGEQAYFFKFNSLASTVSIFHPHPNQIMTLWRIFVEHVDPIIRLVHKPTLLNKITEVKSDFTRTNKPFEALMFSIYFSCVTSMTEEECHTHLGENKDVLLIRYRFALQQSFARAGFLSTHNLVTLQALIIYLICEWNHDNTSLVWTLTSVAIRIAQSLGIHRDGSYLGLSFFETEIRRRIWWQVRILDVRTSENHVSDQEAIHVQQHFDTQVPLNVNDEDLIPGSIEAPLARVGITEMSVLLLRYEIIATISQLTLEPSNRQDRVTTVQQIDRITDECRTKLEEQILKHCNMEIPWHWLIATVAHMMLARMWVSVHHRFKIVGLTGPRGVLTQQCRDRLFSTSIEIVESCLLLQRNESIKQWEWYLRNFIPWQAMAFILSELCIRDHDQESDRAWTSVQGAFDEWTDVTRNPRHDLLWSRMQKLFEKVRSLRVADSNEAPNVEMGNPHGSSAGSTITPAGDTEHLKAEGQSLARTDEMGLYIGEFQPLAPDNGAQAGSQWHYREGRQLASVGPDVFGQFDWDNGMDLLPTAGPTDISNGDFFELDNWW